ncbi:MAG: NAD(P)H-hydrate dehydratase [Halioglobus sp.]|nr:NAD(P)H-hydrate dehydratase [Halioglobus sp.]
MSRDMLGAEKLYTAKQTRALDHCAIHEHGIPAITLMSRAAEAAFRYLQDAWPDPSLLYVYCGTGKNGGDGYLIADLAHKRGINVTVIHVGDTAKIGGDALLARQQARANGVPEVAFGELVPGAGVIVDALLGTGLSGVVRADCGAAIEEINGSGLPVLAADIPSGLCSDTGKVLGAAVRADITVTFIGMKRGFFTLDAPDHIGALQFADLGVPQEAYNAVPASGVRLELESLLARLTPRPASAHKGLYGTVLVVGGDYGMAGAASLAAEAALRCGAGLVRVATRAEHVAPLVARNPEAMPSGVASDADFAPLLAAADVLVVGPGLGSSPWSVQLLQRSLDSGKPVVLDADALNRLAAGECNVGAGIRVFTPHPGEAARLLGCSTAAVQADRFAAAAELQQRWGGVVVLKGSGTLIVDATDTLLSHYGNPGMASGGMGDVLSGVLGALLAHSMTPLDAAALAVCLHGAAADIAANDGQRGLLASDLMPILRTLLA